ncbi:siphovirus Gp157 family protein [Albimonas pacifica]|uniref:Virus Gp157 n=1 Tax=Albimonas pacifica TaxID=1114924 RepID=A0A1I3LG46_9RHOB|nr:siphovirus Gp157 family protein [Albimonas pacifica]SFI83733.1 virus Gp157 [Albimonas pacifica]
MLIETHIYERFAADLRADFGEDDQLVADMLEGETDFHEVAGVLLKAMFEADAQADANKALAQEYAARASVLSARSQHIKDKLASLMRATGLRKLPHALATVSVRAVAPSLIYDGEPSCLPEDLRREKIEADKTAIKKALEAGRTVPGARLSNGGETISIRRA